LALTPGPVTGVGSEAREQAIQQDFGAKAPLSEI